MALKLRPTGLGSGIDKDRPDYTVVTGEWEVGRVYETRGGPDNLRWFWSMTVNGPMTRSDRVATLEEAKAQFQKSWDAWKAWAKLEEVEWIKAARMLPPERPQFSGSGVQTRGMRQHFMNAIAGFHVACPAAIVIEHKKPKRR